MRKNATGKSAKAIDAATSSEPIKPAKSTKPALAVKATKVASTTAKPAQATKKSGLAKIGKAAPLVKAVKPVKNAKASKAMTTQVAAPAVSKTTSTAIKVASPKRTTKGIRLSPRLGDVKDPIAVPPAAPAISAPIALAESSPLAVPDAASSTPATREMQPMPAQLVNARATARKPSRWLLATLMVAAVAMAGFVSTQYGMSNDVPSATVAMRTPTAMGANGEPQSYGPGPYRPAGYRPPYAGPNYGGHYNYR